MSGHNNRDDEEIYFSGGERSGIWATAPGVDLVRELLRKAQEEGASGGEAPESIPGFFSGGGRGWQRERVCPSGKGGGGRRARDPAPDLLARRRHRQGRPAHALRKPRVYAPPSILNVRPGQRVDVQPSASVARAAPAPASSSASINSRFEVDTTQPTTSIQVRLADGTRLIARMNLTYGRRSARRPPRRPPLHHRHHLPTCVLDPAEGACTVKETGSRCEEPKVPPRTISRKYGHPTAQKPSPHSNGSSAVRSMAAHLESLVP
ncbi:hypothetical protein DFH08DRAFT_1084499 [Mycena albidolilacea]|uniref:UBX domain-containing protein n=1 Tax=Mycena albidolilacea TaxID=1033008 RepID=A0AAD6ZMQ7_9AGAR|nr:hypothetical protein DFH08DRAFT_1084499 [Mycena albidolilacea]